MKIIATCKAEQNAAAVDPWTLVHFSAGLAMGLMDIPLRWAGLASAVYEAAEQVFERKRWGQDLFKTSRPESAPNAAVDFAIFFVGHSVGAAWNRTGPVARS